VDTSIGKGQAQLEMSDSDDANWKAHFAIELPAGDLINQQGTVNDVPVEIKLRARQGSFNLTSDHYHIIRTYK